MKNELPYLKAKRYISKVKFYDRTLFLEKWSKGVKNSLEASHIDFPCMKDAKIKK